MSSSTMSRKETERTKLIQEKCQTLLTQMLRDEDNKYCVDCDAKGPRWASWNLGVFLCIRCAGIHRNLGVHISRVKSVNLDTWTPEQVISLQQMGNSRARAVYEAQLPDGFRRPQTDSALESFIRAKYEHKKYLAREWVPPSPPKVDWAKEIDEELEKQKRKKKAAQAGATLGINVLGTNGEKKPTPTVKSAPLPAPLPKPKPGQSGSSPKTQRTSISSNSGDSNQTNDLLGLSSPTKPLNSTVTQDLQNDSFSNFLSASPVSNVDKLETSTSMPNSVEKSLVKEEEDFFKQGSLGGISDKDNSGKLTKDSILALYGTAPTGVSGSHGASMGFGQPFAVSGMGQPSYLGAAVNPHPQQQQFMTPPNSASMYNAPVMTAPTAFTTPGLNMHMGVTAGSAGFGGQFPVQGLGAQVASGYPQQMHGIGMMQGNNINFMQSNQNLLSGISMLGASSNLNQSHPATSMPIGSISAMGGTPVTSTFQSSGTSSTSNLNQQFGNLNIGNVWQ